MLNSKIEENTAPETKDLMRLGTWLGRRQAFGLIANRCSAADAECLKAMRESGDYKKLGLTWDQFCKQHAGVGRAYAGPLIKHMEEFGVTYFRLAELVQISGETYRLIAGAISEEGVQLDGEKIPLTPENRERVSAAVQTLRDKSRSKPSSADKIRRQLKALIEEARSVDTAAGQRLVLIGVLDDGAQRLSRLSHELRATPPTAA